MFLMKIVTDTLKDNKDLQEYYVAIVRCKLSLLQKAE